MQLGSAKLTAEERTRRFGETLCLYCGHSGHRLVTCPLRVCSSVADGVLVGQAQCKIR